MPQELPRGSAASLSIAITGSGGSGAVTAGSILLAALGKAGFYGLMTRSAGPQIRGGESAAMVRFSPEPLYCMGDQFDLLIALDWRNFHRFLQEIPLGTASPVLYDPALGEVPEELRLQPRLERPWKRRAAAIAGGRLNLVALGTAGALLGLPCEALETGVQKVLGHKGEAVVDSAVACIRAGFSAENPNLARLPKPRPDPNRWLLSGNEAAALGSLRGGVRFVAAYPITPATEMLEWLAPKLEQLGGALLQAEDELASINMILGGSFGGMPSLTATSGPGLSLMMEGIGLAVASETPVLVADVMRVGPSTGIPTKSEQSDLHIALYGLHGDAPHLVLAPLDIGDCAFTFQWAVGLAEQLQTAAIVLSDQFLGQSRAILDPPPRCETPLTRLKQARERPCRRYLYTDTGVSPMPIPGESPCRYTADGLEHDERGVPSSLAEDHLAQLQKRRRKIEGFAYGEAWAEIQGAGPLCLISWGSSAGAVREAAQRLQAAGQPTRVILLRLLAPLRRESLKAALAGAEQLFVIEQNQTGQLFHYLHGAQVLPPHARSFARPGPLPLRPGEIVRAVRSEI